MAYTTTTKIKDMGFSWHNFDVTDASEFDVLVSNALAEQITLIKIDYPNYEQAATTEKLILAEAEKYRTAAELKRKQAAQASSDSARDFGGASGGSENLYKAAAQFDKRGDIWLDKIGVAKNMPTDPTGFSSAVVVS